MSDERAVPYKPEPGTYDEAIDAAGRWRPGNAGGGVRLAAGDPPAGQAAASVRKQAAEQEIDFKVEGGSEEFIVDPVPRVFPAAEWEQLEAGLVQRVRALDRVIDDIYGERRAVTENVLPQVVLDTASHLEPEAKNCRPPAGVWAAIGGIDIVRGADGVLRVLEDNVRTPSGIAYAMAARALTTEALGGLPDPPPRSIENVPEMVAETLRATIAADLGDREPFLVLLSDGDVCSAYWEHERLAGEFGLALRHPGQLASDGEHLVETESGRRVDAVYRRTDSSRLDSDVGRLLGGPMAAGNLGVINAFGTGVADDKLTHAYVEDLIRFHLGEDPLLPSVRSLDLGNPDHRAEALDRLEEMVIKPRDEAGGEGVVIYAHADDRKKREIKDEIAAVADGTENLIAQELVQLSTHPTVIDGELLPRHVDLRPFVLLRPDDAVVVPGGLTRVALPEGAMIVNSSQDGGAKDTWVMDD